MRVGAGMLSIRRHGLRYSGRGKKSGDAAKSDSSIEVDSQGEAIGKITAEKGGGGNGRDGKENSPPRERRIFS